MKRPVIYLLSIVLISALGACSSDKENLNIVPHGIENNSIDIYADQVDGLISFYAPDSWSATLNEDTRGARLEWIEIGDISGIHGEVELELTLNRNLTGKERSAFITVFCGNTSTTLTVNQLGIKQNGESGYQRFPDVIADDPKPATVEPSSFFVANEDWYGHRPGSISRFFMNGSYEYPAFANANPGLTLGVTTQFAMTWGDYIYMVSKQGPRLVVADAHTLKMRASLESLGGPDGRGACGIDESTVYISTSKNIVIFDVDRMELVGTVAGIEGSGDIYNGQVGDIVRSGDYAFAAIQNKGIGVIDCSTNKFIRLLGDSNNSGVCVSRDGYVWGAGNPIIKIDPHTLEVVGKVSLPSASCSGGRVGWGAWGPTSLCASTQNNCIFWNESEYGICRYDIDSGTLTTNLFPSSGYGRNRIDPLHDYYATTSGALYTMSGQRVYNNTIDELYLFPSHPFFEDANKPAILTNQIWMSPESEYKICLSDMIYDADDAPKHALKYLSFDDFDTQYANFLVAHDTLYITSTGKEGYTSFDMNVCSHGKVVKKTGIQLIVKEEDPL